MLPTVDSKTPRKASRGLNGKSHDRLVVRDQEGNESSSIRVLVTFALFVVITRGVYAARRGDGLRGSLA